MLTRLYIQNIAVIQKAAITLAPGLNVLTGETGAGKTVLISSIDAVLGERTSRDIIRAGEEKAVVSALFEDISPEAAKALRQLGFEQEDDGSVLISREMTVAGKNNCRINGVPATVSILREIASLLIHIHGQRDAAQLLQSERHLDLIDSFAETGERLAAYRAAYRTLKELQEKRAELTLDESRKAQRTDMLRYQIEEIEAAGLSDENEEEELTARRKMVQGSERIRSGLAQAYAALRGDDDAPGVTDLMRELVEGVGEAAIFVDSLAEMSSRVSEMSFELDDITADLRMALDEFEFDPRELDVIEQRLDTIYKLKRKYGAGIAEILAHYQSACEELERISSNEKRIELLELEIAGAEQDANTKARQLSDRRLSASREFIRLVEEELRFLDMPAVKLSVRHAIRPLRENGMDELEFFLVTNAGDTPKPLSKIASGGEIARIMLSIKNVLAGRDNVATLIFDEVDTGVSGRAAGKIGAKLQQVAHKRQVICVTHLAQVAAYADKHFLIAKQEQDDKTFTDVRELPRQEAISELARITSGDRITPAALQSAGELWEHAHELWQSSLQTTN